MRLNQHFGAFVASLGGFALGVSLAWNPNLCIYKLSDFRNPPNIIEMGLVEFTLNIGACLGVLCAPFMLNFFSYTGTMFMTIPLLLFGWAFICFSRKMVILIMIGRLICGICGGIFCVLSPIYISEIADKEIRNRLLTFFHLLVNCGVMYAYFIAYLLKEYNTIWQYSLICAISCAPIALVNLFPESTLYHLSKNDESSAKRSLEWYKGRSREFNDEMEELKSLSVIYKRKVSCKIFRNSKVWNSFFACFGVILTQQISLINIIISWAHVVFEIGNLSGDFAVIEETLIVGGVQIIASLVATILVDIIGRRILLVFSSVFMGIFLVLLGWFMNLRDEDFEYDDIYFWMAPTWIALYYTAFNLGVGPLSWSLYADVFPVEIKVIGATTVAFLSWGMSLLAIFILFKLLTVYDKVTTVWVFAGFSWIGTIFILFFVQETKGKSLTNIQENFVTERDIEN